MNHAEIPIDECVLFLRSITGFWVWRWGWREAVRRELVKYLITGLVV